MIRKAFKTCAAGLAAGLGLLGGALPAMGQTPPTTGVPGDWPNLGAFNNRQGRNVNPYGYNSGDTMLRWETPNTYQERNELIVDNTDLFVNAFSRGGPYDDPFLSAPYPAAGAPLSYATAYPDAASWPVPDTEADAAQLAYVPSIRTRQSDAARALNYNPRTTEYFDATGNPVPAAQVADYNYAYCVPSAPGGDGTTLPTGNAKFFQWLLTPPADGGNAANTTRVTGRPFALYMSLPIGPAHVNSIPYNTTSAIALRYPQRYYVVEIRFGPDRDGNGIPDYRIVDILDTERQGDGFVRLGMSNNEENTFFPSDGSPILVRLYNTVPRDTMVPNYPNATGQLLLTGAPTVGQTAAENALASQHLVYADAVRALPQSGTFLASPTTATISGNTTNATIAGNTPDGGNQDVTADWNVTAARTNHAFNFSYASNNVQSSFTQNGQVDGYTVNGMIVPGNDGVVTNYQANPALWPLTAPSTPVQKWQYSLAQNISTTVTQDDNSGGTTASPGFAVPTTLVNPNHIGTTYLLAASSATGTDSVTYRPDLSDGDYDIYAYIPGNYVNGAITESYATAVTYEIYQGATLVYTGTLDESLAQGWVRLGGSRRFPSTQTALPQEPLSVVLYNKTSAADASATPVRKVYADALKFVGQSNSGFSSTPVHATVGITPQGGGTPVDTKVVLVADDTGRLHCLDEAGRGDGTTTEYWTYPSTIPASSTAANPYMDPNLTELGPNATATGFLGPDGTYITALGVANVPTAKPPTGFNLSTAAIARITDGTGTKDFLYVGASNGRVYCVDMAGRGDYDVTNRLPGTARRRWTFPDDYDPSNPSAPIPNDDVGAFRGSIAFGYPTPGDTTTPTIYVASYKGRVYALDARGTQATTHTTAQWQFPAAGQSNLPNIVMTPSLFLPTGGTDNRLMFGTLYDDTNEGPGQFYCISARTGTKIWAYNDATGTATLPALPNPDPRVSNTNLDSFVAGPVAVDKATLGQRRSSATIASGTLPMLYDTIYVLNQNGYLFGLNVDDGTLVSDDLPSAAKGSGSHVYITSTLDALTAQNLTFTFASDFVRGATLNGTGVGDVGQTVPMIVIPGANGVLAQMLARPEDYNTYTDITTDINNPLAEYDYRSFDNDFSSNSAIDGTNALTSAAASNNYLFVNDIEGSLYALDGSDITGNLPLYPVNSGYTRGVSPNDPRGDSFRHLRVRLINRTGYNLLKQVTPATGEGPLTFTETDNGSFPGPTPPPGVYSKNYGITTNADGSAGNPYAFEWGETAYVLVYNFPYATHHIQSDGTFATMDTPIAPPDVTVTFSVEGRVLRAPTSLARKFKTGGSVPNVGGLPADGYAVVAYAFNNSGNSALPPGNGRITASIQTAALSNSNSTTPLSIPQPRRGGATIYFVTANPLAVTIANPATGLPGTLTIGGGVNLTNGGANENVVNGTPNIAATTADPTNKPLESQLHAPAPITNHGTSTTTRVDVYDRSLIVLLHEDGLSNFRVTRSNLQRQGGTAAVFQRLNPLQFPGFEDFPTTDGNNNSLDYPDIGREQVRAALGVNGSTENPIAVSSTLLPPTVTINGLTTAVTIDNYDQGTRVPTPTPLDLTIDVPRYQPPVDLTGLTGYSATGGFSTTPDIDRTLTFIRHDSLGQQIAAQGYFGRVQAFIDSNNDNKLSFDTKETFRSFNMSTGVSPQYSVLTGSPTVDLGSLASGTGYAPADPQAAYTTNGFLSPFSPWFGDTPTSDPRGSVTPSLPNWSGVFKPIIVRNDGNLNLLNLRLAKAYANNNTVTSALPWALPTADNDPLAWMTGSLRGGPDALTNTGGVLSVGDLWSNIDSTFAAQNRFNNGINTVVLAKPRVTDRLPTELVADPYPRANPNLALSTLSGQVVPKGTINSKLVDGSPNNRIDIRSGVPSSVPKVGVSVPLGFPVGSYSAQIRVVENILPLGGFLDNDILQIPNNQSEVFSDPITLTYKVRETRMTNGPTRNTAPVIDPLVTDPNNANAKIPTTYRNSAPTALRDIYGQLVVAWSSDRASTSNSAATATARLTAPNPGRIFLANVVSGAGSNGTSAPAGNPPLWDLSQFRGATSTSWFNLATPAAGYPDAGQFSTMFPGGSGPIAETVSFDSPSFPQRGVLNPLAAPGTEISSQTSFGSVDMAFVGDAQVLTNTGRVSQSRVFMTTVNTGGQNGGVSMGSIVDMGGDPQTKKGKPAVLQLSTGALVFFSETGAGQSSITVSRRVGTQSVAVPLSFGDGFSSVFSPSANARQYVGGDNTLRANNGAIVDLSFAGKLRGRSNAEVYLGRLRLNTSTGVLQDSQGTSIENRTAGSPFALLPEQTNERTVSEGNGVYRARGVDWSGSSQIALVQNLIDPTTNTLVATNLLVQGTKAVDRQSGLIAYDSRLGGKVYIDPQLGTIRFAGAFPNRNAEIRVTYTPYFLRVTPGGTAGYSAVNGLWDDRYALDYDDARNLAAPAYWYTGTGTYTNLAGNSQPSDNMRNDRYFFAYARGAAGGGVTARPYTTTMRLGIRLPTRIATDGQGNVVSIQVQGNARPYQVDPANGRVYFMADDEDKSITITYTGVNEATNIGVPNIAVTAKASFVLERTETPLAVDEATNDTALSAFVDPFTSTSTPRPPLYWLFYVSTRAGGPDLYFQSIAPRFTPFAK